jgi:hypothetical protein
MDAPMKPVRYRVNVTTTSKGLPAIDVTVDGQDSGRSAQALISEHRVIMQALVRAYPPTVALEPGTVIPPMEIETTEPMTTLQSPSKEPQVHSEFPHTPDLCWCYDDGAHDGDEQPKGPVCSECNYCICDACDALGSPSHARDCSLYPHLIPEAE